MNRIKNSFVTFFMCLFFSINNLWGQVDKPLMQFGLIADIQYGDCETAGSRFYRNSLQKVEDCVNYLNAQKVQFTLNLGDMVDRNFEDFDAVLACLGKLDHKLYNITGNHDYKGVKDNEALYKKLNMPSEYYSFKKKNWVFVFLNTNEVASYANVVGTGKEQELNVMLQEIKATGGTQGASYNGGVSAKQLIWLDGLLAKSQKAGERVLIFSHHPLYPPMAYTALNNLQILDIIGNYSCVKAIFSGHHHSGAFTYFKDIPVVTVEGMIETKDKNSFGVVKLYDDRIVLEGQGRMTSREFKR